MTLRNLDWLTVAIYLLMVVAGAISIYAASYDFDEASIFSFDEFSGKQLRWIVLSLGLAFVCCLSMLACMRRMPIPFIYSCLSCLP